MPSAPKLITLKAAMERLQLSRTSVYRRIAEDPSFPRPVKISPTRTLFVEAEIDAFILAKIGDRQSRAAA